MAVKCNIPSEVLERLKAIQRGNIFKKEYHIVENYVEFLNCKELDFTPCHTSDCINTSVVYNCSFAVRRIRMIELPDQTDDQFIFTVEDALLGDGFKYQWAFDETKFSVVGNTTDSILRIYNNGNFSSDYVASFVSVTVTNPDDCTNDKICYFSRFGGITCTPYNPCLSADNLMISTVKTECPTSIDLEITPIYV